MSLGSLVGQFVRVGHLLFPHLRQPETVPMSFRFAGSRHDRRTDLDHERVASAEGTNGNKKSSGPAQSVSDGQQ